MSGVSNCDQAHFRFRGDTEAVDSSTITWLAAEDGNITMVATTVPFRVRFSLVNTGTVLKSVVKTAYSKNGGSYVLLGSATTAIFSSDAGASADNTSVTTGNFRLTAGAGSKIVGNYDENSTIGAAGVNVTSLSNMEIEIGVALVPTDLVNGDTIDLRLFGNSTAAPLESYTQTPRITIGTGTTNNIMGQVIL